MNVPNDRIELVQKKLNSINSGRWHSEHYEFQDGGEFLLITLSINEEMPPIEIEKIHTDLKESLKDSMPIRSSDCSWMVTIKKGNTIVDTTMGGHGKIGSI